MIDAQQARVDIIRPALSMIGLHSMAAENLILLTGAAESRLGSYVRQVGGGPALAWMQIEPATHADVWENYLRYQHALNNLVAAMVPRCYWDQGTVWPSHAALIGDLRYSAAIARIIYRRAPEPLPKADDWPALAAYHVRWYNRGGKASVEHTLAACDACGVFRQRISE